MAKQHRILQLQVDTFSQFFCQQSCEGAIQLLLRDATFRPIVLGLLVRRLVRVSVTGCLVSK